MSCAYCHAWLSFYKLYSKNENDEDLYHSLENARNSQIMTIKVYSAFSNVWEMIKVLLKHRDNINESKQKHYIRFK